nr:hypothetical protein [Tanacetum cinerariifolium]
GTLRQWICFHDHERRAVKGSYMGFDDFLQGTLRQWICFRDHERRAVKGSYMGFDDFLQ